MKSKNNIFPPSDVITIIGSFSFLDIMIWSWINNQQELADLKCSHCHGRITSTIADESGMEDPDFIEINNDG